METGALAHLAQVAVFLCCQLASCHQSVRGCHLVYSKCHWFLQSIRNLHASSVMLLIVTRQVINRQIRGNLSWRRRGRGWRGGGGSLIKLWFLTFTTFHPGAIFGIVVEEHFKDLLSSVCFSLYNSLEMWCEGLHGRHQWKKSPAYFKVTFAVITERGVKHSK